MELIIEGESKANRGMKMSHDTLLDIFGDTVTLVKYWGPVQMCVFYLEYDYTPNQYKIIIECERGFITISVINQKGDHFSPWMIYPESRYYHFEDVDKDIYQLISLTHQAILKNDIEFFTQREVQKLTKKISFEKL
jgi:hypothetical protein